MTKQENYKTFWIKVSLIFIGSFFIIFLPFYTIYTFLLHDQAAWLISTIIATSFSIFASAHLGRELRSISFEINSVNKDPQKGLDYYYQGIQSQLIFYRYVLHEKNQELELYEQKGLGQIMGGKIYIKKTPYYITITAPVGFIKILASSLDLDRIIF